MRLAIFGGTGLIGSALVELAVQQSHEVTVLVRDPEKTRRLPPAVRVVTGDALDPHAVRQTIDGCDAVMSTLGGLKDPESLSRGTANVIDGMRALKLRRLVVLQGMHLVVPGDAPNLGQRLVRAFMHIRARDLAHHSELMWNQLRATTDIDWTLVRIPRVGNRDTAGNLRIGGQHLGPWDVITRRDAAEAMMRMLHEPSTAHTAPVASSHGRTAATASSI